MADQEKGFFDRAKEALGFGDDNDREDHDHHDHDHDDAHEHSEVGEAQRSDGNLGVDGSTQGAASTGAGGGLGASAALGGAGAGGPAGAVPDPSKDVTTPASGDRVRTEYEMGHEFDPEHEKLAESGLFAEQAGDAVVDTRRRAEDEEDLPAE